MNSIEELSWIKTGDGSLTLWNNELSESYRSLRGAFSEACQAFVMPAMEIAKNLKRPIVIGEFGLGPGTNWLLWQLISHNLRIESQYWVIEYRPEIFDMGFKQWSDNASFIQEFLQQIGQNGSLAISDLKKPNIVTSIDTLTEFPKCDLWFHDPFGQHVNPEGYSTETLQKLNDVWSYGMWGFSYACNKSFQKNLQSLDDPVRVVVEDTNSIHLKRQKLSFQKLPKP